MKQEAGVWQRQEIVLARGKVFSEVCGMASGKYLNLIDYYVPCNHYNLSTTEAKLLAFSNIDAQEWVLNVCVHGALWWTGVWSRVYSRFMSNVLRVGSGLHHDPDQNEVVTESKCVRNEYSTSNTQYTLPVNMFQASYNICSIPQPQSGIHTRRGYRNSQLVNIQYWGLIKPLDLCIY